jgi:hypothetical protein
VTYADKPCCGCFPQPAIIESEQIIQRPAQRSEIQLPDEEEESDSAL